MAYMKTYKCGILTKTERKGQTKKEGGTDRLLCGSCAEHERRHLIDVELARRHESAVLYAATHDVPFCFLLLSL